MSARSRSLVFGATTLATALGFAFGTARLAGAADAGGPDAGTDAAGGSISGCVESIPKGATRPDISQTFPTRGASGWAATLLVTVHHGRGERVLPAGLEVSAATEARKYLSAAGFVIPDQDGGAAAHLRTEPDEKEASKATTVLELPLLLLPPSPGRTKMELPPLPVTIARANGELEVVCTAPHTIVVEDPIANVPDARPVDNPPPRPQREEWTSLRRAVTWGALGLAIGAALAYAFYRWKTRPIPPPPPPPPRPPWEVALEKLDEVRHAGLLDAKRYAEYFDRVSDAVRGYLGARFGFDGLESTTDEILTALRTHAGGYIRLEPDLPNDGPTPGISISVIVRFLGECDLVKFANLTPTPEQCENALEVGERIVRATSPTRVSAPPPISSRRLPPEGTS